MTKIEKIKQKQLTKIKAELTVTFDEQQAVFAMDGYRMMYALPVPCSVEILAVMIEQAYADALTNNPVYFNAVVQEQKALAKQRNTLDRMARR